MTIYRVGAIRGEAVGYPDGVGCAIWYPEHDDEHAGVAFDFPLADIDDLISLLTQLKQATPDLYVPEDDHLAHGTGDDGATQG